MPIIVLTLLKNELYLVYEQKIYLFTRSWKVMEMTKAFNDKEKEIIKRKLMEKGKEMFELYGLKKTSISDLTKAVGIAQGSFYSFFESKELLYYEIVEQIHEEIQEKLLKNSIILKEITRDSFKDFMMQAFELVGNNAILKRMLMENEYEYLVRKLPEERLMEHAKTDVKNLVPLIEHWQSLGMVIDRDPLLIVNLVRTLFVNILHKKEIGEELFKPTMELLVELVAKGLIIERGELM
ncbi:MAG: TetR/AcrR family transcriptional regulator [Bacillota bacterium]